jgi:predicted secreted acid phosphatase
MLVGDDFNDFVTGAKSSLEQRARLMKARRHFSGTADCERQLPVLAAT